MADEDGKILQLVNELEKISSRLNYCKEQLIELKRKKPQPVVQAATIEKESHTRNTTWEYPSHKPGRKEGLEKMIGLGVLQYSGIIALVIGISIGVKYAIDKDLITPAARIGLAYLAGIALYFLSVRLKKKYHVFSAILLSGSMASLYFTSFAAYAYYDLFNGGVAFALMLAITVFTIYSAIRYDREIIAILGMAGAYTIPFLISVNSGRADLFFAYIILINIGIAILAFKKSWMSMTGLALFASWILFFGWGFLQYEKENTGLAVIVVIVFNLLFSFTTIGYAIHKKREIVFNELSQFLLNDILTYGAAILIFTNIYNDAVADVTGFAFVFFVLQAIAVRLLLPTEKLLLNSLIVFSLLALIFYIGMKWTGMPVTMGWLLTAAAAFVIGVLGKINWLRFSSVLITITALGKLILIDRGLLTPGQKIISYIVIGAWMLLLSYFYQRYRKQLLETKEE
ncbi:MAG: DUF2339 domain-containing protein [Chitinophagaceae bacterium]|nr:DUF2339 domain-containing protein [Chitinophagaceae bacterium]